MRRAGLLLGLLTTSALAEPRHIPPGLNAVVVVSGEARLHLPGHDAPDDHLTLLPEGVFFNQAGYELLTASTNRLQDDLAALRGRLDAADALAAPAPPPIVIQQGWRTHSIVLFFAAGVLLGAGGLYVVTR
jgi:hypothetical protein